MERQGLYKKALEEQEGRIREMAAPYPSWPADHPKAAETVGGIGGAGPFPRQEIKEISLRLYYISLVISWLLFFPQH